MKKVIYCFSVLVFIFTANTVYADSLADRLSGKILLQVQEQGQAWYVNPADQQRYFLGRPQDAFNVMRLLGVGISDHDIKLIPDGPLTCSCKVDINVINRMRGKIMLQTESHGEAWYLNPKTSLRRYLGRPRDAFNVMREYGLGITNRDLQRIPVGSIK